MKTTLNKSDLYLLVLFFVIAIPITLSTENLAEGYREPIVDTIIYAVFTFIATYISVYKLFPRFLPEQKFLKLLLLTLILFSVLGFIELTLYRWSHGKEMLTSPILRVLSWSVSSTTQNAGLLIGLLLGKKFYETQLELQKREKQKREKELMLLKAQIDPHFLFNNLNTVDALIDKDPNSAKAYLNHLSKLYRYLIRTKDDEVVDLAEEVEFAENYMYLIEQRYGSAYQFSINNLNSRKNQLVPPGALQTVLENVVKHNTADRAQPIHTVVTINDEDITITNNIRPKYQKEETSGTGLSNLMARYKLLSEREVKIDISDRYTISLPILNPVD